MTKLEVCNGCKKPIKAIHGRIKCTNQQTGEVWYFHQECSAGSLLDKKQPTEEQPQLVKRRSEPEGTEVWVVRRRDERGDDSDEVRFIGVGLTEAAADRIIAADKAAGGGEWGSEYIKQPQLAKE